MNDRWHNFPVVRHFVAGGDRHSVGREVSGRRSRYAMQRLNHENGVSARCEADARSSLEVVEEAEEERGSEAKTVAEREVSIERSDSEKGFAHKIWDAAAQRCRQRFAPASSASLIASKEETECAERIWVAPAQRSRGRLAPARGGSLIATQDDTEKAHPHENRKQGCEPKCVEMPSRDGKGHSQGKHVLHIEGIEIESSDPGEQKQKTDAGGKVSEKGMRSTQQDDVLLEIGSVVRSRGVRTTSEHEIFVNLIDEDGKDTVDLESSASRKACEESPDLLESEEPSGHPA